jgi:type IV secretion system protein VirB10
MYVRLATATIVSALVLTAQEGKTVEAAIPAAETQAAGAQPEFIVERGTRVPLSLINSVSTKHASPGDRLYLETVFPILVNGRIVIPPGSWVAGTVTDVKRPGRIKGRGELYVRFDSLTLPNGTTRDFRARIGALDGRASETLDKDEGKIKGDSNKGGDARTAGESAAAGASIGVIGGAAAGRPGMGAAIGGIAGAAAGLVGVLLTRGPDAMLTRGETLDMVLDRDLRYTGADLENINTGGQRRSMSDGPGPLPKEERQGLPIPGRRLPL